MGEINVTSTKQRIIVDPAAYSVSVIYTGRPVTTPVPPAPSTPMGLTYQVWSESSDMQLPSTGLYDVLVSQMGQKAPYPLKVIISAHIYFGFGTVAINAAADLYSYYHAAVIQASGSPVQAIAGAWMSLPFNLAYDVPKGGELGKKLRVGVNGMGAGVCWTANRMVTQYIQTGT